jgi:hypothetical protein
LSLRVCFAGPVNLEGLHIVDGRLYPQHAALRNLHQ